MPDRFEVRQELFAGYLVKLVTSDVQELTDFVNENYKLFELRENANDTGYYLVKNGEPEEWRKYLK